MFLSNVRVALIVAINIPLLRFGFECCSCAARPIYCRSAPSISASRRFDGHPGEHLSASCARECGIALPIGSSLPAARRAAAVFCHANHGLCLVASLHDDRTGRTNLWADGRHKRSPWAAASGALTVSPCFACCFCGSSPARDNVCLRAQGVLSVALQVMLFSLADAVRRGGVDGRNRRRSRYGPRVHARAGRAIWIRVFPINISFEEASGGRA